MVFLRVASKAVKIPYRGTCQPAIPLPLVEILLWGLFPQRNPQSSKICPVGEISRHKREPEGWLTGITTVKETCPVAAELSQSHGSCGKLQQ